ncbi:hypothetical protein PRIPAC_84689 [Pristionchus pacificus]|uniref:Tyrosine phosphatase n=1 Tax=Pristionchus pacificus TaxID=54126 RepID=A0A2A6BM16_PRIPA|nr:hypothetical protein PRIPAC_84689 [Pristionchus pacificus]|eukprot:PDM66960.1 tyrosine phosphatase [Pristionchus pacificus]
MSKSRGDKTLQQEVHGDNLNDFVACLSAGGRLKQHAEHDAVRKPERQINKFTRYPDKNRFFNAVLFSQGSIDLQPEIKEDCSYINASRLPCPGGALIMAQAPMKETILEFYRLIWQQQINTIVCLVNLEDREQCYPYFERKAGKKITCRKRFRVRTVAVRTEGKHIIHYELKIENYLEKGNITSRVLNVISILGWEPDSQFDVKVIVSAIHSADALKRIVPAADNGKCNLRQATFPNRYTTQPVPMLIHGCSGIRRTGVFALAYLFSKQILGKRQINLLGMIESVRMVRYGVLRQKNMFYLLLECIVSLITETGLVKPGSDAHVHAVQVVKQCYKNSSGKSAKRKVKGAGKGTAEKLDTSQKSTKKNKNKQADDDDEDNEDGTSTRNSTNTKASKETTGKDSGKSGKSIKKKKEKK